MHLFEMKRWRHILAGSALVLAAAGCGGDKSPTGPGGGGNGLTGTYTLARIGLVSLPAYLTIESCMPTRFTDGSLKINDDGTWAIAVAVQNDDGDTKLDDDGDYEQEGTALWFDSATFGDSFQGTVEDGVIKMDYDFCSNGQSDIQLVFGR